MSGRRYVRALGQDTTTRCKSPTQPNQSPNAAQATLAALCVVALKWCPVPTYERLLPRLLRVIMITASICMHQSWGLVLSMSLCRLASKAGRLSSGGGHRYNNWVCVERGVLPTP